MALSNLKAQEVREALIEAGIHYGMSAVNALRIINEVLDRTSVVGSTPEGTSK